VARRSCRAARLDVRARTSAARAVSGRLPNASTATSICTFTPASVWATTSWTSRATRRRSASARSAAARSAPAACSAASSWPARTASPQARGTIGHSRSSAGDPTDPAVSSVNAPDHTDASTPTTIDRRRLPCTATE
jgi:hypothetical protein